MMPLRRILVVKLADLGDLLTATPALRALRNAYPSAHICALVTPHSASLLEGSDAVDEILTFQKAAFDKGMDVSPAFLLALAKALRQRRFDAMLLLHHLTTYWGWAKYSALSLAAAAPVRAGLDNGRGWFLTHRTVDLGFGALHEADYWLEVAKLLGGWNEDPRFELRLGAAERSFARSFWSDRGMVPSDTAVLHPGSGLFSLARRWPAEGFASVARALQQAFGLHVAVMAGPGEESLAAEVIALAGGQAFMLHGIPGPRQLAAVLEGCRLLVANDSGVMHLGVTMKVPTVAVFGLTNHRAWGPYPPSEAGAIHRVVRLELPCSPCLYVDHKLGRRQGCPPRTCLESLEPDLVLDAAASLLTGLRQATDRDLRTATASAGITILGGPT